LIKRPVKTACGWSQVPFGTSALLYVSTVLEFSAL
jgi:hypothetical protein